MLIEILALAAAAAPAPDGSRPAPGSIGNCIDARQRSVDLHELYFLSSPTAVIESRNGSFQVTLAGEHVEVSRVGQISGGGVYKTNIGYEVEPRDDLDVELKLAYLTGNPVIYWKETYRHRIYRQGLFRVVDMGVEAICQGKGGVTSYD